MGCPVTCGPISLGLPATGLTEQAADGAACYHGMVMFISTASGFTRSPLAWFYTAIVSVLRAAVRARGHARRTASRVQHGGCESSPTRCDHGRDASRRQAWPIQVLTFTAKLLVVQATFATNSLCERCWPTSLGKSRNETPALDTMRRNLKVESLPPYG